MQQCSHLHCCAGHDPSNRLLFLILPCFTTKKNKINPWIKFHCAWQCISLGIRNTVKAFMNLQIFPTTHNCPLLVATRLENSFNCTYSYSLETFTSSSEIFFSYSSSLIEKHSMIIYSLRALIVMHKSQ